MRIKPIKNLYDYQEAQNYIESVFHAELSEEESDNVAVLEVLMEEFERKGEIQKENVIFEPLIDYVFDLVTNASKFESPGLIERGLKLGEEYGELSAEILKLIEYKKTNQDKETIKKNILLESTDCLIMIFDIMAQMGFKKEDICEMAESQVNKWMKNINLYMGLIKKFDSFVSEKIVAEAPIAKSISKPVAEPEVSTESAAQEVIDRLSNIYKDLPAKEKKDIDKYFE